MGNKNSRSNLSLSKWLSFLERVSSKLNHKTQKTVLKSDDLFSLGLIYSQFLVESILSIKHEGVHRKKAHAVKPCIFSSTKETSARVEITKRNDGHGQDQESKKSMSVDPREYRA